MRSALLFILAFTWGIYSPRALPGSHVNTDWIGKTHVTIYDGRLTAHKVDAYMVPHFPGALSRFGLYQEMLGAGAGDAMEAAGLYMQRFPVIHGDAFATKSDALEVELIHVIAVGASPEKEFEIVHRAVLNGMEVAAQKNLKSIAIPVLGITSSLGSLSRVEAADAIMNAIWIASEKGSHLHEVRIVLGQDWDARGEFEKALKSIADMSRLPKDDESRPPGICERLLAGIKRVFVRR